MRIKMNTVHGMEGSLKKREIKVVDFLMSLSIEGDRMKAQNPAQFVSLRTDCFNHSSLD